jgi:hypothetical protein
MALTYRKYIMSVDHCWYDSSNIKYSECFDTQDDSPRVVKVVFKGGRTYIYRDVDVSKYVMFRDAASQGLAFGMTLKNCPFERVDDTPVESLDRMLEEFRKMDTQEGERNVELSINNETGEFVVKVNGTPLYEGVEGRVSVINLFAALGIVYTLDEDNGLHVTKKEEFENNKIE